MIKLKLKQNSNINKPWVNFYDEGVPKTIDYPDKTLWEMIKESADRNPNFSHMNTMVQQVLSKNL